MPRPPRISAWPSFACPGLCDDVKGATAPRIAFQEARVFPPDHNPIFLSVVTSSISRRVKKNTARCLVKAASLRPLQIRPFLRQTACGPSPKDRGSLWLTFFVQLPHHSTALPKMSAQVPEAVQALSPNLEKSASPADASSTSSANGSTGTATNTSISNNGGSTSSSAQVSPTLGDALDTPRALVCRWNQCNQKFTNAETLYVSMRSRNMQQQTQESRKKEGGRGRGETALTIEEHLNLNLRVTLPGYRLI